MPKSRKRRSAHKTIYAEKLIADPHWPALWAVMAAEARGDAGVALDVIADVGDESDDGPFWHPSRVERLEQIWMLAPILPRWAHSRWIVGQAAQWADPSIRDRSTKALEIAVGVRGDPGMSDADRVRVMERDWVHRQVLLYELGVLDTFLRRAAAGDLVAGADRIHDWSRARMRSLRLCERTPLTLTWEDLTTHERLITINIGSGVLLDDGECALGRVVPIEQGLMFETAPLRIPDEVAYAAATDPADWLEPLRQACPKRPEHAPDGIWVTRGLQDYGLLTDVPHAVVAVALDAWHHALRDVDDDLGGPLTHPDDYPACLAAWLTRPATIEALGSAPMQAESLAALESFAAYMHEPAPSLLHDLAVRRQEAA